MLDYDELNPKQQTAGRDLFQQDNLPRPDAPGLRPGPPFPHISNLSLNLAVVIRDGHGVERFARVKVPSAMPRLVPIKRSSGGERKDGTVPFNHYFVWLEQVVAHNLDAAVSRHGNRPFPPLPGDPQRGHRAAGPGSRRPAGENRPKTCRCADSVPVICLALDQDMPADTRQILVDNLMVNRNDVYELSGPLGMSGSDAAVRHRPV